jgi:hypothetical protein
MNRMLELMRVASRGQRQNGRWRVVSTSDGLHCAWAARVCGATARRLRKLILQWRVDDIFVVSVGRDGLTRTEQLVRSADVNLEGLVFRGTESDNTYVVASPLTKTHGNVYRVAGRPDLVMKIAVRLPRARTLFDHVCLAPSDCTTVHQSISFVRESRSLRYVQRRVNVGPEIVEMKAVCRLASSSMPWLQARVMKHAGDAWCDEHDHAAVLRSLLPQLCNLKRIGVVHGDIKPLNVCVRDGSATVIDFETVDAEGHQRINGTQMFHGVFRQQWLTLTAVADLESALLSARYLAPDADWLDHALATIRELTPETDADKLLETMLNVIPSTSSATR